MNKLLPIMILLLFATATASATTLHGTVLDADTGDAVGGVKVILAGSSSTTWTDSNGKFDLTVPKDTAGELGFESADPCYYTEVIYNPPSSVEGYYPDTDELWVIIKIPSCTSDTDPSTGVDPEHPGPNGGNGDDGKTPSGMIATSTAGRWGGGILSAIAAVGALAIAVIAGVISAPALIVVAAVAAVAFVLGFAVLPILTEWGVPGLSWLTGSVQDAGNAITNAFGFHFDTTDPKTFGEAIGDGVADIVKTVSEHVINVFLDAAKEATGLSETMIWILVGAIVVIGLLMWYSQRQQQSMMYTLASIPNRVRSKK
jgi:hypothetical protein